jgi:hypothetical protein
MVFALEVRASVPVGAGWRDHGGGVPASASVWR